MICGATTGFEAAVDLRHLFARQLSLLGCYMGRRQELLDAAPLFFAGKLKPVIDEVLPLAEIRRGHERLEASQQFGKIVVVP